MAFARVLARHRIALAASLLLAACGGGGGDGGTKPGPGPDPVACLALPNDISWQRGSASSEWTDVLVDAGGRLWLAGWTDGIIGQTNIEPSGNSRPVLRALAADGKLLWDLGDQFDTPGTDTIEALAVSASGTVYAAGRTTGSLAGMRNAGQFDSFIAWSDAPGSATPWSVVQSGNAASQHPRRLVVDKAGGVVLAGEDDDYVPDNHVETWSDAFVQRWQRLQAGSSSGQLVPLWNWQAASPEPDVGGGLALMPATTDGATFVSGSNRGGRSSGMVLRKLDANGQPVFTVRYTTAGIDHVAVVRALEDGSLLIGGSVFGSFQGGTARGQHDVFVARVDAADGHVLQSWQFGSSEFDWLVDLQVDAQGNWLLFGETGGSIVPGAMPAGQGDLFLMKLAPDGRVLASRQWGTAGDERAARVAVDRCGHVVAVGSSTTAGRRDALAWFWRP